MNDSNRKHNNTLKEKTLEDVIDKEVTKELLDEMKISTIEEYKKIFQDHSLSKNYKNSNGVNHGQGQGKANKLDKKNDKISNSKKKYEARKKQTLVNKKIKNEMRTKILISLEKHNVENSNLLKGLDSAKNLGRKRNKSNDIKKKLISEEDEINEDEEESESESEISIEEIKNDAINTDPNVEQTQLEQEFNESKFTNKFTNNIIQLDTSTRENIIDEIKKYREKEELLLNEFDDDDTVNSLLNLEIPEKSNLILINREESIQNERLNLPIVRYEHEIMDKINNSLVTVVCGETGSGKSTQIPQFLYEYGYTKSLGEIVITQPRRVAAISLASRVSKELNTKLGEEVGYQVRYDSKHLSSRTVVKYVTDGILLKELESDKLLLKYSVVIIDEAHERSINTDIIIGILSKIVRMRYILSKNKVRIGNTEVQVKPLRVVIMSATMRVDEFMNSEVFKPHITPSFMKIEARQYPVTVHHAKRTLPDYVEEAFKLCCKIHRNLPSGGILIFLTGKKEINYLCNKLNKEFESGWERELEVGDEPDLVGDNPIISENNILEDHVDGYQTEKLNYKPYLILPLYSSLPQEQQTKIFEIIPENTRLIVLSTNVAETSLTIPMIRYVIDSGKSKKRIFKGGLSFSTFKIEWISQASAEQRTGRAGRTGPGFCYRLYSNGLYSKMEKYTEPQIVSSPLDQTILYLKSLHISDISKFPFLTMPTRKFVEKALRHLIVIGALKVEDNKEDLIKTFKLISSGIESENKFKYNDNTNITEIGKLMVKFPIAPKFAKILILANKLNLLEYAMIIVAIMSVENIFENINEANKIIEGEEDINDKSNNNTNYKKMNSIRDILELKMINPVSDSLTYLNLILALIKLDLKNEFVLLSFCKKYYLNIKKIKEMLDLIDQLNKISKTLFCRSDCEISKIRLLSPPTQSQQNLLIQVLLSGFIDNIARKKIIYDEVGNERESKIKHKKLIYECNENNEECQIHPQSILSKSNFDLVIYKEIIKENKSFLICNSIIKPEWLYNLGGDLVSYSLNDSSVLNEPFYNKTDDTIYCYVNIKFGYKCWDIQRVKVEMNENEDVYFRYLAKFFIEGQIFPEFAEYTKFLNSKPNIITNKISVLPKVTMLVNSFKFKNVKNKKDLVNNWRQKKKYLLLINNFS